MWAHVKAEDTHREARNTRPGIVKGIQPVGSVGRMCIIPLRASCDEAKNRPQTRRMRPSPLTVSSLQIPHVTLTTGVLGGVYQRWCPGGVGTPPSECGPFNMAYGPFLNTQGNLCFAGVEHVYKWGTKIPNTCMKPPGRKWD